MSASTSSPDVIGEVSDIDVDSNSEAAGKLDLAKIYIEMNDDKGAISYRRSDRGW